ncbi:MAG: hypothetical protein KKA16_02105 [Alphaproteobacteria bacterium]|uniref:Uncharacterized protein n=1 Tax=viral metagenome TaxID=1070528 RepID=A0A6H1ZJR9_9ZZZZ|nr:hypothetical protein [Alphaproteobacteria bacterium]MBU2380698.1 hypothetical protein [Alphaproteobacteria bacterium]
MSLLHNAEADFAASELARIFIANPTVCYSNGSAPSGLSATATRERSSSGWPFADGLVALLESGSNVQREIAIEYKRPQEGVHGILTAIGQAQAYLHKGYGGAAIVLPNAYSSHQQPGQFVDAVLNATTSSPAIGVFCYDAPDITSPTPFAGRLRCIRALDVASAPARRAGAAAARASTQWVHMREGSTTRDGFFRFLQAAKRISAGDPPRAVVLPKELRAAAGRLDGRPPEWYLSNTTDDSLLSRIWREFWFEWIFTSDVARLFGKSGATYKAPGAFCKIARDDASGLSQIFEGRSNGLKESIAAELNAGAISEPEAWELFITGFAVPGKQNKQGVRERAHSYREDVDSALGKLEWIDADGMPTDRGYRYSAICERFGGAGSVAAVDYVRATLLQAGHYGSFIHYVHRLSERIFSADPLAFTRYISGVPRFTEDSYWEYLAVIEDEMVNNLRVMRKVSTRARPRTRTTFQVELTLLRNYGF